MGNKMRVYKYGLLPPTTNNKLVEEQFLRGHKYRIDLREIEIGKRNALRLLTRENDIAIQTFETELATLEKTRERISAEIKQQHSETRSRLSTKTDKDDLKTVKDQIKEVKQKLYDTRNNAKTNPIIVVGKDEINNRANELIRSARKHCGLYWATYQLIEEAAQAAHKMSPMYDGSSDNNPNRIGRYTGQGTIGGHFQENGGLENKSIWKDNTIVRITEPNDKAFYGDTRSERKKHQQTIIQIRVGSDDSGNPIFASFPMIMHRPLPDGCKIKWVKVSRKFIGRREKWSVSITVDMTNVLQPTPIGNGIVAWDLGYRDMSNGGDKELRMGKIQDEDGNKEEIRLPTEIIKGITKADELRSVRDKEFDEARTTLVKWIDSNSSSDWLSKETETLSQWKSVGRLGKLVKMWACNRFMGDDDIFDTMEKWRYHDQHLWDWEASQRTKALNRRKEFYRVKAAELANKYEVLVIEDFDLRDVSKKAEPEAADDNKGARSNKKLGAPSEFRLALINAFSMRNGTVVKIDPKGTSYECHLCGSKEHLDPTFTDHTCKGCGETWDREDNATANLLKRYRERAGDAKMVVGARKDENGNEIKEVQETRYERRRKATLAKQERIAAARKDTAIIAI